MPTYEYRCSACEKELEVQQKMTDPELTRCEACGKDTLERLISWTAVRSHTWQRALFKDNPKEALKGTHAVDLSVEHRFKGHAPGASDAAAAATAPASSEPAAEPTAASPAEPPADKGDDAT